ncbi:hypothetical protein [Methylobacterium planeticum]|uniref:Uncharacterized protein n=1 Tax=Methylobacterium planeticum TaxID=2615211 RepID=A0A6N6MH91_9HYPH|nr:hypothetical protein [Methylobacterium planeticum]KAB1068816.1 hypothetical protein F6X51_26235 [Methylobacterium planeticum]
MKMYRVLAALLCAVSGSALARDDAAIAVPDLIAKPQAYIGELVVVRGIRCVDPGGAGFLCAAVVGDKALRIDALVLGPFTTVPIAERLTKRCKGASALDRAECRVDIALTPTSFEKAAGSGGPDAVTVVHAAEIEMYTPRKR